MREEPGDAAYRNATWTADHMVALLKALEENAPIYADEALGEVEGYTKRQDAMA